ncbi:DUF4168 domain-containing protein [Pelagibacterium lentulum]|uniref:DUF4168 domain-containing protein n=1 Tax=Pelagibacterium lentulum TaxID=2029865 RepID=A0A916W0N6_9HYPH|nr:DUF4168 domain-containing protein [Pelagibacterium lentulum]GGA57815.1 hypothetical protein GCM10011499_30050 [Pelagibacterium lentulum]
MTLRRTALSLLAGTALLASGSLVALAQENTAPPPAPADPMMTAPMMDFSDSQLQAFAVAYVQVNEIGMEYDQQMQAAQNDEELMELQMQAQMEMTEVVEATDGLTVEEYNMIFTAAQTDPELGGQVQTYIDAQLQ